jgi:hypothetical protein
LLTVLVLAVLLAVTVAQPISASPVGITIQKVTTNSDTTTEFTFQHNFPPPWGGGYEFNITGGGHELTNALPDHSPLPTFNYTYTELIPGDWVVTDISCRAQSQATSFKFMPGQGVTIHYDAGDSVVCTFTNCPSAESPPTVPEFSLGPPLLVILMTLTYAAVRRRTRPE